MTGYSLHIGLNHCDPNAYPGWDSTLAGCINDANSMRQIASSRGFLTQTLIDGQATAATVLGQMGLLARTAQPGDITLISYSGHGGQLQDYNGDEADAMDETWVLYDRQVCDDELNSVYAQFQPGVRILVVSDSCHSGTVARSMVGVAMRSALINAPAGKDVWSDQVAVVPGRPRAMPVQLALADGRARRDVYEAAQAVAGSRGGDLQANLILLAGCQDNQLSYDGDGNGAFTGALLSTWADGSFSGGYSDFLTRIRTCMPPDQTPNYFELNPSASYAGQHPFTVTGGSGGSATTTTARPTLRLGDRGPDVVTLQQKLNANGAWLTADGSFGPVTQQAVISFQRNNGLTADGVVGPQTWAALDGTGGTSGGTGTTGGGTGGGTGSTEGWGSGTGSTGTGTETGGGDSTAGWGSDTGGTTGTETGGTSTSRPTVRRGSTGVHVTYLQQRLCDRGYVLTPDGQFGPATESAVRSFQRSCSLTADGVVGPQTWAALG